MMVLVGRTLQIAGMIILPAGLMIGLFQNNLNLEVRLLFIGGAVYLLGWLMARKEE